MTDDRDELVFHTVDHTPFGDVVEGHDRADDLILLTNRGAGVLDDEAIPIFSPEHLVAGVVNLAILEGTVDRTLVNRIGAAVGTGMVNRGVEILAVKFCDLVAKHPCCRWIHKRNALVSVDAGDPISRRVQNHLVLKTKPRECLLILPALSDVSADPEEAPKARPEHLNVQQLGEPINPTVRTHTGKLVAVGGGAGGDPRH